MKIVGLIPARYASSRFPGKPLALIFGKPMIEHVYGQALKAEYLDDLFVATDDSRIEKAVMEFGGKVIMTLHSHTTGTERCAEAQDILIKRGIFCDVIVNIQGDEPFIHPNQIDIVASCFKDESLQIATLVKRIENKKELFDSNVVKAISDLQNKAIYFSRQTIPYLRNTDKQTWLDLYPFYKHIGIYGYRSKILQEIVKLAKTPLEDAESLEQLRWIENGYKIHIKETNFESYAIDTPADLSKFSDKS